jgi:hypothetical protein
MTWSLVAALLCAGPAAEPAKPGAAAPDLAPPVKLLAAGKPIDVDVGHAAPFVADLNGDGNLALLVGQFGDGKLRVYPFAGERKAPRLEKFTWFQTDSKDGKVPAG